MFGTKQALPESVAARLSEDVEAELANAVGAVRPPEALNRLLAAGQFEEYRLACAKYFELLRARIRVTAQAAHFSLYCERTPSFPSGYMVYSVSPARRAEDTFKYERSPLVHPVERSEADALSQSSARPA
jgi:hypothetical protein